MAISPTIKKAYWSLAAAGALYFCFLSLLLNGWVQRQALYAHKINTKWWHDPNRPEKFGFLRNQVRPFHLPTPDGEKLYGWHILPLTLYTQHSASLAKEPTGLSSPFNPTLAFSLLAQNPSSRLIISFHGNAGTVSQGWRTDAYRALASARPHDIHILTIDYRGFGYSTGTPTEAGLITDGIALVNYALHVAKIPPERIIIHGQSLGTAVSVAVAEHFAREYDVQFKAVVLVAAFANMPSLMSTYAIGGVVPILSPLRPYPVLQRFFERGIQETWFTDQRLDRLVRESKGVRLFMVHARNDFEIPWSHSQRLFYVAANATSEKGLSNKLIDGVKWHEDLGEAGWIDVWKAGEGDKGRKEVKLEVVPVGGHNRITTYPAVVRAILNGFSDPPK